MKEAIVLRTIILKKITFGISTNGKSKHVDAVI